METSGVWWRRTHGHPPEEILERYSMDRSAETRLSEEECEQVEEHLLLCESCRKQLEECDQWVALMKAAAVPVPHGSVAVAPPPVWQRWWQAVNGFGSWPALAGGMATLFAVLWVAPSIVPPSRGEGSVTPVSLSALRGNDLRVSVPVGKAIELNIEDQEVSGASILIVDAAGNRVWSGTLQGNIARIAALKRGFYWVRLVSADSGEQLKEYGLSVE